MAAKTLVLKGIAHWAKLWPENRSRNSWNEDTDGAYTIDLVLDEENASLFESTGAAKKVKYNDKYDGQPHLSFSRPHGGPKPDFAKGPVIVKGPDGKDASMEDGLIWNGSEVGVQVAIYNTKRGIKGTDFQAVQVYKYAGKPEGMDGLEVPDDLIATRKELNGSLEDRLKDVKVEVEPEPVF